MLKTVSGVLLAIANVTLLQGCGGAGAKKEANENAVEPAKQAGKSRGGSRGGAIQTDPLSKDSTKSNISNNAIAINMFQAQNEKRRQDATELEVLNWFDSVERTLLNGKVLSTSHAEYKFISDNVDKIFQGEQVDDLSIIRLGSGGYGTAYLVNAENMQRKVVKVGKSSSAHGDFKFEFDNVDYLSNAIDTIHDPIQKKIAQNAIQPFHFFPDTAKPFLLSPYLGLNLMQIVHSSNFQSLSIQAQFGFLFSQFHQAVRNLSVLHTLRVNKNYQFVHRDIKPGNLVCDRFGINRFIDFGLSAGVKPCIPRTLFNDYAAPEFRGFNFIVVNGSSQWVGPVPESISKTDLWSLGSTFLVLLAGEHQPPMRVVWSQHRCHPYKKHGTANDACSDDEYATLVRDLKNEHERYFGMAEAKFGAACGQKFTQLEAAVKRFLIVDPAQRASAADVLSDLE